MGQSPGTTLVLIGTPVRVQTEVLAGAEFAGGGELGDHVAGEVSGYVYPATLRRLALRTGGIAVNLGSGDPGKLIEDMFSWLRTRYVISYDPPAGKGWHPVSVKVNKRGVKVTVREGYFVD